MGATIIFAFQRNGIEFGFWFCPPYPTEQPAKTRIAYNGLRVYEPVARAQRLCLFFATAVTEREGWAMGQTRDGTGGCVSKRRDKAGMDRAPSDEQREERCVNPLLGACGRFGFQPKDQGGSPILICI